MSSHVHPVVPESPTEYEMSPSPVVVAGAGVTVAAGSLNDVVGDQDTTWAAFDTTNVADTEPAAYRPVAKVDAVTVHDPVPV